jgi:Phage integrase family
MLLVAYRHGLRASEVCDLQWHQVELDQGRMHVRRAKNGTPSVHPIRGDEIRALRKLRRDYPTEAYVFVTERGGPHLKRAWMCMRQTCPPGRGDCWILKIAHAPSPKNLPQNGFLPQKGGSLSGEGVFAKKNFQAREKIPLSALAFGRSHARRGV